MAIDEPAVKRQNLAHINLPYGPSGLAAQMHATGINPLYMVLAYISSYGLAMSMIFNPNISYAAKIKPAQILRRSALSSMLRTTHQESFQATALPTRI